MRYSSFYSNFSGFRRANDRGMTNDIMLHELADAIVSKREDVIDKLNQSGIATDSSINPRELANRVIDNINKNKKFADGMSLVLAKKNHSEFENFSSMGGKTKKDKNGKPVNGGKINVISDVSEELKRMDNPASRKDLVERVSNFDAETNTEPSPSGGGLRVLIFVGLSALAVFGLYKWKMGLDGE